MIPANDPVVFKRAMAWLLRPDIEGGYVNDVTDRGGETKYGISARTYPNVDIKNLTMDQATDIYWRDYWQANYCGALPAPLALALFDAVVQHQPRSAGSLLQQALGVLGDGIIGPQTITAARQACTRDGGHAVLADLLARRAQFYAGLVTANSSQARFLHGWMRRLFLLHAFINQDIKL